MCVWLCVYYPVYLSPVCWIQCRLVYLLFPVFMCVCIALSYLDVVIKDYYFELVSPRLRVPRLFLLCAPWQLSSNLKLSIYIFYIYNFLYIKLFPLKKCNWLHWCLHVLRFNFHSPHKLICLNCFSISIGLDFILGKSWWFEKAKLIKHGYDQLTVCRWPLGRYFKKEKKLFNEQKNAPNVFLN